MFLSEPPRATRIRARTIELSVRFSESRWVRHVAFYDRQDRPLVDFELLLHDASTIV